jgi:hypothetical protein
MYRNHRFAAESFFRSGVDRPDHSRVVDNAVRAEGGTSRTGVIIGFVQKSRILVKKSRSRHHLSDSSLRKCANSVHLSR